MASKVDIANLALAHLGDDATVTSLDPPEGSAQAGHCARFYPLALDSLLEMHPWGFATQRLAPAQIASSNAQYEFAYALPNNTLNVIAVLPADADDDFSNGTYTPQPFVVEADENGLPVLFTDQENPLLRLTVRVEDTNRFSPLFVQALSWHLASMLAGVIIKGDAGAAEAKRCLQMAQMWANKAMSSDGSNLVTRRNHVVSWLQGR